ncbi:MAG: prepilin-type N-terminal cleavage/methylation domain-containing protein [Planctomycetota bacterium]
MRDEKAMVRSKLRQDWRASREQGMTLIELLTVLAIVTALMGLSAGIYQRIRHGHALPAAVSQVSSVLRAARNYALTAGIPSKVFIEPQSADPDSLTPGRITAFGYETAAAWHFEDLRPADRSSAEPIDPGTEVQGALNEQAVVQGECYPVKGKIGTGIEFVNDGASIVADHRPRYHSPTGFSLEAWTLFFPPPLTEKDLRGKSSRKGAWKDPRREDRYAVISKHGSYEIGLLGDGACYVLIGDLDTPEESYFAATRGGVVLENRWAHLHCRYDGLSLTVEVDGTERECIPLDFELVDPDDWPPFPPSVPWSDGRLSISHPTYMFLGVIDQPKIRMAIEPRTFDLPAGIYFLNDPQVIRFDTRGSLDPLYHVEPVVVRLANFPRADLQPPEESDGLTGVATPAPNVESMADAEDDEEPEVGDPMAALAKYLEENTEGGVSSEAAGKRDATDQEAGEDGDRGEVQSVIVDLTGTIRG